MTYQEKRDQWLADDAIDIRYKNEIENIKDEKELEDRFYKDLEFGTAGLRGVIGAGTNRMNIYTVGLATQGLANYINNQDIEEPTVVISYDSRNMSIEFANRTANVLNANGIKTYIFDELHPVPMISFAVRELNATAGVMITASHNPAKYNGYKVYWSDGAQITEEHAKGIMNEIAKIENYGKIRSIDLSDAPGEHELYCYVPSQVDDKYFDTLKSLVLNPEVIEENKDLSIVYTPLHGAGNKPVQRILKEIGFENVHVVPEQEEPDGNFPTVDFPNPEHKAAFGLALALGTKVNGDVILATDPDADRLGVYAKDSITGEYKAFTGNESALLIAEYRLSQMKEKGILPENSVMIRSLVSSNLANPICKEYGIELEDVLTGFKYIGEKIREYHDVEEKPLKNFVFGFEESYGCLFGTYCRDKDGVAAVMALCEAAAYYKSKGLTLYDQMQKIYEKYGYYMEDTIAINLDGKEGIEEMERDMENRRNTRPVAFGKIRIENIRDYMPTSNVLYYELENDWWFAIRPSGTEPKVKQYFGVKGTTREEAENNMQKLKESI